MEEKKLNTNDLEQILAILNNPQKDKKEIKKTTIIEELKKMECFEPLRIAEKILEYQKIVEENIIEYVPDKDQFYQYNNENGYWERMDKFYITQIIRNITVQAKEGWSRKSKDREILNGIKILKGNKENNNKFNAIKNKKNFLELINLKNGMLDWKTGKLHEHRADYYSTIQLPVKYNPNAEYNKWNDALKDWINDEETIKFMQEYIGYTLIPDTSLDKTIVLFGNGSNGKSTFLEVINNIFGDKNMTNFCLSRFVGSSARWQTAYIENVLVNIASDIDPKYIENPGLIKNIISGEGITVEHKHGAIYNIIPFTRFIFSANELPKSRDKNYSWYRRFEFIRFPNEFSNDSTEFDPFFKENLIQEISGIFNWAVEGLRRLYKNKKFTISKEMKQAKMDYIQYNDPIASFLEEETLITNNINHIIKTKDLYNLYKNWSKENGHQVENKAILTHALKREKVVVKNKNFGNKTYRIYQGIKIS